MLEVSLLAAFIAGIITFLAPCTLPLVPGYLGFISGLPPEILNDPKRAKEVRWRIFWNGFFFILGFSVIFIILGTLIGLLGSTLTAYQVWLNRVGGALIVIFGLMMLDVVKIHGLSFEHRLKIPSSLERGKPTSSFIIGSAFGVGWTPCVGPILGAILALSATVKGALEGAFLLSVFSAGLAVPFLVVALGIGQATRFINTYSRFLKAVSVIGGLFLIFLGVLLFTGNLGLLLTWGFQILQFLGLGSFEESLINFL